MTSQTSIVEKNMKTWQLQEAKAHFSEVVRQANQSGPQQITLHGALQVINPWKD